MATLYVNGSTGNDSRTYATAQNPSTPWRTIDRAAKGAPPGASPNASQAAAAGDTVSIAAGTYTTTGSGDRFIPAYNPVNSGVLGNPITFLAEGLVTLTFSSGNGPVIGSTRSYVTWRGHFYIDDAFATPHEDIGPVVITGVSVGCVIDGIELHGQGGYPWPSPDNYPGIRLEYCTGVTIKNCTINNYGGGAGENECGIQCYRTGGNVIEHNNIVNCGAGIFLKGIAEEEYTGTWDIRYNYIADNHKGIIVHRVGNSINPNILIYQNVIARNQYGVELFNFGDATSVRNTHLVNNTIYDTIIRDPAYYSSAFAIRFAFQTGINANCSVKNNIFSVMASKAVLHQGSGNTVFNDHADIDFNRNLYFSYADFGVAGLEDVNTNFTFAQWQGSPYLQDPNALNAVNPLFVNATGNNFRLQAGSPAKNLARVVFSIGGTNGATIDAGAYITGNEVIGPTTSTDEGPAFLSASATTFTVGSAGTFTVIAAPSVTSIVRSGSLPTGVTYTDHANGTGTLAGTPGVGTEAVYPVTFTATNTTGSTPQSFSLTVQAASAALSVPVAVGDLRIQGIV